MVAGKCGVVTTPVQVGFKAEIRPRYRGLSSAHPDLIYMCKQTDKSILKCTNLFFECLERLTKYNTPVIFVC